MRLGRLVEKGYRLPAVHWKSETGGCVNWVAHVRCRGRQSRFLVLEDWHFMVAHGTRAIVNAQMKLGRLVKKSYRLRETGVSVVLFGRVKRVGV